MARILAYAFWGIAGPVLLYGMVMAVGETVEHFTP